MLLIIFLILSSSNNREIEVRFTEIAPQIDGVIEEIWEKSDSAYNFVQFRPYESTNPSERTSVYALQDEDNLYIAFRCYADSNKPIACYTADEDWVTLGIDPFGNKTSGYYFRVFASNIIHDGWILDDGREYDDSWEGFWYRASKIHDGELVVEVKIPFKSIRYSKGLNRWGIQFERYSACNQELSYWTEVLQEEEDRVSNWGSLANINPQAKGYHFEVYPEGYIRNDRYWYDLIRSRTDSNEIKPRLSLNAKWDITPEVTLNTTLYPDYAQIEADPFILNLGRYPTYLEERRPFFLEGSDIFHLSGFGDWGFFEPLEIFYSRRIGKSMNGDAVPIIGGLKFTGKTEDWNFGILSAYTDEYERNDTVLEPGRVFGIVRLQKRLLRNSSMGMLFNSSFIDRDNYNYALGFDGVYREGPHQSVTQGVISDKNGKQGWAFNSGYALWSDRFMTLVSASIIQDSFDVSDIGFVPWAGAKRFYLEAGPRWQPEEGTIRQAFLATGIEIYKEPGIDNWSYEGFIESSTNFRNNWGLYLWTSLGRKYEADTNFMFRSFNFSIWGRLLAQQINFGGYYAYDYNYRRGFVAYRGNNWFVYNYSIFDNMSVGLNANLWIEWNPDNEIISLVPLLRPNIFIRFNADMTLRITTEFVLETPGTNLGGSELLSLRNGLIFSWNFFPKSWIYIALNDYRDRYLYDSIEPQYQIAALKLKYLLYF